MVTKFVHFVKTGYVGSSTAELVTTIKSTKHISKTASPFARSVDAALVMKFRFNLQSKVVKTHKAPGELLANTIGVNGVCCVTMTL